MYISHTYVSVIFLPITLVNHSCEPLDFQVLTDLYACVHMLPELCSTFL